MAVTFTGDDAQAKMARAKADLEVIRGKFAIDPTPEELAQAIDETLAQRNLPRGNETDVLRSLHKTALDITLAQNDGAVAKEAQRALFYMGYTDDAGPAEDDSANKQVAAAEKAIPAFLAKHPEFTNTPARDLPAKISDMLWAERPQAQAATNATNYGPSNYGGYGGFGGSSDGYYAIAGKKLEQDVRRSAEATFGKGNIELIQAQLYMRDPAHNHRPDGTWTLQDQNELVKFVQDENNSGHKANPIPSPLAMRWQGSSQQTDFAARVTTALTNSSIIPAQQRVENTQRKDIILPPTQANGNSNPNDIQKMQLYLKLGGYTTGNNTPTGIWTVQDQAAMQKYLDDDAHKNHGWFGSDPLPARVEGLSGADFQKILAYASDEAKSKHGITPELANKLCPNITTPQVEPAPVVKPVVATPTPTATATPTSTPGSKPSATPTATATPTTPAPKERDVPHTVTANAQIQKGVSKERGIADNDVARMQAQLNLMGYYNGQINGKATDTDEALKAYAQKKGIDLKGKTVDDHNVRLQLRSEIQKDWDSFARINHTALQGMLDAGHAKDDNPKKSSANDPVRQMQVVILAAGGKLPDFGVDGVRWHETDTAYKSVTDAKGQLIDKPATTGPKTTPTPTSAPSTTPTPTAVAKPTNDDDDDPIGPGGFITPPDHFNVAPTPTPDPSTATPTPTSSGDPDFTRTGGPTATGGRRSPVVNPDDIGSGRSSGLSDYYNGQACADHGSASRFFQKISTPYINELGRRGWPLETLPNAKDAGIPRELSGTFRHDQGQAFLTGPDGRFAAQYAMNGGNLTYVTTYDLDDPAQNQAYQAAKVQAERQNAKGPAAPQFPEGYPVGGPFPEGGGTRIHINIGGIGRGHEFEGPRGGPPWRGGRW